MSLYMVIVMTFVITTVNTGFDSDFPARWGRAFLIAWPIAFVVILIGAPTVQKLADKLLASG
ncbi:MAG: DUF2798 domain-containing protein [Natronospirillum sp.]|uniref:DUF2798 domain-containing protein n=1 Tax=Natronospirillum sp. TaxID=2812955 RepID=UPI0025E2E5E0|nr:DUF2798 domain-containing protein [Natronospirillum sp.]MCH8552684.1 DUF2798 domain-containing protein [Natronospirillum sp.]